MPNYIPDIEQALQAAGELLAADGERAAVVIAGGAALNLLGTVDRSTRDVDVLALADPGTRQLRRPDPLPASLARVVATVARDLGLPSDWLNTQMAGQWDTGLPPGLPGRITWRRFAGLSVGIVSRLDLIFFKLYAAADDTGPQSVHFQDLLALRPKGDELAAAADWVRTQDPSPEFGIVLDRVVHHVQSHAR